MEIRKTKFSCGHIKISPSRIKEEVKEPWPCFACADVAKEIKAATGLNEKELLRLSKRVVTVVRALDNRFLTNPTYPVKK